MIAKTEINLRAGWERKRYEKMKKDDCKLWQEECIDWLSALMAFNFPDWLSTLSLWWMRGGFNHNSQPDETRTCTHTDNTSHIQRKIHAVTHRIKRFARSNCSVLTVDRKLLQFNTISAWHASTSAHAAQNTPQCTVTGPLNNNNNSNKSHKSLPFWFMDSHLLIQNKHLHILITYEAMNN